MFVDAYRKGARLSPRADGARLFLPFSSFSPERSDCQPWATIPERDAPTRGEHPFPPEFPPPPAPAQGAPIQSEPICENANTHAQCVLLSTFRDALPLRNASAQRDTKTLSDDLPTQRPAPTRYFSPMRLTSRGRHSTSAGFSSSKRCSSAGRRAEPT